MKITRETTVAGAVIYRTIKGNCHVEGRSRAPKTNPTTQAAREWNDRQAAKRFEAIVNANFLPGDIHAVLTYAVEPTVEQAAKDVNNFIRRMKREYKKLDIEFKYAGATEGEDKRIHHHILMSNIDTTIIDKQWKKGIVKTSHLGENRDYSQLADYIIKRTNKTFRDPENLMKRRYFCSRNLYKPITVVQEVSAAELYSDIKEIKGYTLNIDSIRRYVNPVTGIEHLEYSYTANDPEHPRYKKKWRGGKIKRHNESLIRFEKLEQMNFFSDYEYEWRA